ncbi:MAG: hypothetical protein IPJ06_19870 [Saprospiraceae bacterium]|nr:hypothetical protein [Saprospiraceae bacterium]
MVVSADSIYLFTKQWKSLGTAVYALSGLPGDQIAELRDMACEWIDHRGKLDGRGPSTGPVWIFFTASAILYVCCDYQVILFLR